MNAVVEIVEVSAPWIIVEEEKKGQSRVMKGSTRRGTTLGLLSGKPTKHYWLNPQTKLCSN